MRYYKITDDAGQLVCIGEGLAGDEITEEEYNILLADLKQKRMLTDKLYWGEITIADVPDELKEQIQSRVDELIARQGPADAQEISDEEAMSIILGGDVE